ncbi:MAG TPA: glycosyltransferase [Vicinamibacterales bacterium]|nr:glycosyltransferase [Vicinamibacterales bacterium]
MSDPVVSIALLTKNGAETLPAVLQALWRQRVVFPIEIVAVDSGSTDDTLNILRSKAVRVIEIPPESFNHGTTRNLAMQACAGQFVVMLVQDAEPVGDQWLNAMLEPFVSDPLVAGTFARQQPRPEASEITRRYLARWVAGSPQPRITAGTSVEFETLDPLERMDRSTIDNVCACIRRDVWLEWPFREVKIGEDVAWGRDVILAGYRLAYAPDAVVIHSHDRSPRYEYQRTRDLHEQLGELFGVHTIPTFGSLARAISTTALKHLWWELGEPRRLPRALALAVAWPLGQYVGGRRLSQRPSDRGLLR